MTPFLSGELSDAEQDIETARFRVIPMPLERTVSYGAGTAQGPAALLEASVELERLWRDREPCAAGIHTEAPVDCDGDMAEVMDRLAARTQAAVSAGKIPVTLGGEHSLTFGAVQGVLAAMNEPLGIVQIDAHADLRKDYQGHRHSHASVMRLLVEETDVRLAQFGVRALSREEADARQAHSVFFVDAQELVTRNSYEIELPHDFPEAVYVSFDVDGLDPSILPATGTPVPGGLGYYQALSLVEHSLRGRRMVGCDVVELAPCPGSEVSDFTAASVTYALMGLAG